MSDWLKSRKEYEKARQEAELLGPGSDFEVWVARMACLNIPINDAELYTKQVLAKFWITKFCEELDSLAKRRPIANAYSDLKHYFGIRTEG